VLAERLAAQRLSDPTARTPEEVVGQLLAVQAQDPRGFRLSIRSRSVGLTAADVDAALSERRTLVVTWLNRGTLHLVPAEDYWWLHPLTTPQLMTGNYRRLSQEGVSRRAADRGVAIIREQVKTRGPRTRDELRTALDDAGVRTQGQALVHLLFAAALGGDLIRGPMRGTEQCFVAAEDWLGAPPTQLDRPVALARLARRYLAGHGPADAGDLAKWAGITVGDARNGLRAISGELVERQDGLVDHPDNELPPPLPSPRLLGAFDPLLHGWASREFVVGSHAGIVTTNGLFRPFALVNGKVAATWRLERGRITLNCLQRIQRTDIQALEKDAADVLRFLNLPSTAMTVTTTSIPPKPR
jgi:Winged helix DNA-binding domain